jgi:uncharacterized phage protein gp47/JayE
MAFVPRSYETILADFLSYVQVQSTLTDFEIGAVGRTILEAAALEDDEQYFQMVQLLDAFRLSTASGKDLDDRLEEYGIIRLQPQSSSGPILITDNLLVKSELSLNVAAAAVTLILEDSSQFPTVGFPYTVRIGEGTISEEDVLVFANVTATNTLTSAAVLNAHAAGQRVAVVSGAADRIINPALRVQVPATGTTAAIKFATTEEGTLINGNYYSTPITARAENPGSVGNIGTLQISEFSTAPPFDGAGVTNQAAFDGGRDLETDAELRDRGRGQIQSLTKGTVLALKTGVIGIADTVTGQRVTTANVLEDNLNDEVIVYVDDGTGFIPDKVVLARTQVDGNTLAGSGTLVVDDVSDMPDEGFVLASTENPLQIELLNYSSITRATKTLNLVSPTVNNHDDNDEVVLIDYIEDNAEPGTNFFYLSKFPVVRNTVRIWLSSGGAFVPQVESIDYIINRGTGQIEFLGAGVAAGAQLVSTYAYYTGLIKTVQTVIDGDPADPTNFPGIRAAGIQVIVETPTIRRITVRLSITTTPGREETDVIPQVQEAVEAYINGLGIGEDVIVAEIVQRAMDVSGMFNVVVTLPSNDVVVLENELPVPFDSSGNSLVTVT